MASDSDGPDVSDSDLLPDERAAIEGRLEELEQSERRRTTADVAEKLGIALE